MWQTAQLIEASDDQWDGLSHQVVGSLGFGKKVLVAVQLQKKQKKTTTSNTTSNEDKPCMLFYSFTEKLIVSSSH